MKNRIFFKTFLLLIFLINYFNIFALYFPDVEDKHWSAPYIKEAVEKGIIRGFSDGTFKPNNSISFAEAISITFKTFGKVNQDTANLNDWKVPYINYYNQNEYITETYKSENYINKYNDPITRELAIYVLLKTKGINFGIENEKNFSYNNIYIGFNDVKKGDYYALYIKYAKDNKIIKGYENGEFGFGKNITRAEFLSILLLLNKRNDLLSTKDYISSINLVKVDNLILTISENAKIKGQSFVDSTKIASTDKVIYNNRWYTIQNDDYYKSMNDNQTLIKVAGSFGDSKKIYHNEADGWTLAFREGYSSKNSGDLQRMIDIIRYNENFYFEELTGIKGYNLFGGINSLLEFKLVGKVVMENYGNYKESYDIKTFIKALFIASPNFDKASLTTTLCLK